MGEKDISEKILADHNDVFADIVNVLLFHGLKRVTPDALQNTGTTSHYKADDQKLHEQERDVMKAWTNGGIHIALIGIFSQKRKNKNYIPDDTQTIQHVDEVLSVC